MSDAAEPEFFCGWCLGVLVQDGCPACEWIWAELMTRPEAQAFQDALNAEGSNVNEAWAAVLRLREGAAS